MQVEELLSWIRPLKGIHQVKLTVVEADQ
ncbi:hypothetical protein [Halobellus sp. DFY28]|nr:hypothetical protein [Halobellus sp. DFY28]